MGKFRSPWKKGTTWMVLVFILVFLGVVAHEAKAETTAEINFGLTSVGGNRYDSESVIFRESFNDKKIYGGLLLQLRLDCRETSPCRRGESERSNQAVFIERVAAYNSFQIGVGISYWHTQSPAWDSNTPYVLSMRYTFENDLMLSWYHFSTGGSSESNGGLDMINFGYRF